MLDGIGEAWMREVENRCRGGGRGEGGRGEDEETTYLGFPFITRTLSMWSPVKKGLGSSVR